MKQMFVRTRTINVRKRTKDILTYKRVKGTEEMYYDVFDMDGKYITKIPLDWNI